MDCGLASASLWRPGMTADKSEGFSDHARGRDLIMKVS
jgi:hypothetical protein